MNQLISSATNFALSVATFGFEFRMTRNLWEIPMPWFIKLCVTPMSLFFDGALIFIGLFILVLPIIIILAVAAKMGLFKPS